ncbi:MAG: dihydropteroate synthase [Pyrinomonadaceae bacterium]|nr:dihydropteroate synthase [Pyrinomonadaceae bacterium]
MIWRTSKRELELSSVLIKGIVNTTPDSFSDGGEAFALDDAVRRAERLIEEGADILDIGGESTRPGSERVSADEEIDRIIPVIRAVVSRFDVPISVDTSKAAVAEAALESGAEIVNDISGLRFDPQVADAAAAKGAGLVLMHSRGEFSEMHSQTPVADIFAEVENGLRESIEIAVSRGVSHDKIALDVGIGFGKTVEQNLSLIANLARIVKKFEECPMLVGASRKSFIGKLCNEPDAGERLGGSLAAAIAAVRNGAKILRVHDVRETRQALKTAKALGLLD